MITYDNLQKKTLSLPSLAHHRLSPFSMSLWGASSGSSASVPGCWDLRWGPFVTLSLRSFDNVSVLRATLWVFVFLKWFVFCVLFVDCSTTKMIFDLVHYNSYDSWLDLTEKLGVQSAQLVCVCFHHSARFTHHRSRLPARVHSYCSLIWCWKCGKTPNRLKNNSKTPLSIQL